MSKSLGNFFHRKGNWGEEFDLEVLRFFLLSAHYRNPINFNREVMEQLENGLDRLYNTKKNLEYLLDIAEDSKIDQGEIEQIDIYKRIYRGHGR